jgi:hypothetical protein
MKTKNLKDPVILSGGDLGGTVVEGEGWAELEEHPFTSTDGKHRLTYRRIEHDENPDSVDQAVLVKIEKV